MDSNNVTLGPWRPKDGSAHGGGGPPDNEPMEARVKVLEAMLPTLSTKADIAETRTEIQRVTAEVQKGTAELHKWMLATVLAIIGTLLAAIFGVAQVFKGQQQAQIAPTPIIINVPGAPPAPVAEPAKKN